MDATPLLQRRSISVSEFRCSAAPDDTPFVERHPCHSVSYVRKGSFGCHSRGRFFELVAGSILVGHPGDEYVCTHDHVCGDECLSFFLAPGTGGSDRRSARRLADRQRAAAARIDGARRARRKPQPSAAAMSASTRSGQVFASRFVEVVSGRPHQPVATACARSPPGGGNGAFGSTAHSHLQIDLEQAAGQAGISPFHFLRLFSSVLGVTPHQYLVRSRLRHAARLLADNDIPITDVAYDVGFGDPLQFRAAPSTAPAGVSPRRFREGSRGMRKIFQERLALH
jgi:AraC-like DNA-binding protein